MIKNYELYNFGASNVRHVNSIETRKDYKKFATLINGKEYSQTSILYIFASSHFSALTFSSLVFLTHFEMKFDVNGQVTTKGKWEKKLYILLLASLFCGEFAVKFSVFFFLSRQKYSKAGWACVRSAAIRR